MNKAFLLLILLTSFFSCSDVSKEKKNQENYKDTSYYDTAKSFYSKSDTSVETYNFDTILKGGYIISFSVDNSTERLHLKKNKIIKEIASCSRGLPYKNLGYKAADFTDYFVLAHSFGSGNPNYIELIKKDNGLNILKDSAAWIAADEEKELLLYCETGVPTPRNKMILYDINRKQKEYFDFPKKIFDESMILNRIQIDTITDKLLIIGYETQNGLLKEKYDR
ncbi:MAG TPA: hypothetical protein VH396_14545 [Chitinophagaceae bacterium]|jgi:hypothetical protein